MLAALLLAVTAQAAAPVAQEIRLRRGESHLVNRSGCFPVAHVDLDVLDVKPLGGILVVARAPGTAELLLLCGREKLRFRFAVVEFDGFVDLSVGEHRTLPETGTVSTGSSESVRVSQSEGGVLLTGLRPGMLDLRIGRRVIRVEVHTLDPELGAMRARLRAVAPHSAELSLEREGERIVLSGDIEDALEVRAVQALLAKEPKLKCAASMLGRVAAVRARELGAALRHAGITSVVATFTPETARGVHLAGAATDAIDNRRIRAVRDALLEPGRPTMTPALEELATSLAPRSPDLLAYEDAGRLTLDGGAATAEDMRAINQYAKEHREARCVVDARPEAMRDRAARLNAALAKEGIPARTGEDGWGFTGAVSGAAQRRVLDELSDEWPLACEEPLDEAGRELRALAIEIAPHSPAVGLARRPELTIDGRIASVLDLPTVASFLRANPRAQLRAALAPEVLEVVRGQVDAALAAHGLAGLHAIAQGEWLAFARPPSEAQGTKAQEALVDVVMPEPVRQRLFTPAATP